MLFFLLKGSLRCGPANGAVTDAGVNAWEANIPR